MKPKLSLVVTVVGAFLVVLAAYFYDAEQVPGQTSKAGIQSLLAKQQFTQALAMANKMIRENPQDTDAQLAKGIALGGLQQRTEAMAHYQQMIRNFPNLTEPYNNLAALYAADGRYENARQTLEKGLQIHGSYAIAYKNLNAVYAKLADQAYSRALDLGQDRSSGNLQLRMLGEQGPTGTPPFVIALESTNATKGAASGKPSPVTAGSTDTGSRSTSQTSQHPTSTSDKAITGSVSTTVVTKLEQKLAVKSPEKPETVPGSSKSEREINVALEAWATAWSKQDVKTYLSHYANNFDPGNMSRNQWESERRSRISGKSRISVTVSDVTVTFKSSSSAQVKFRQNYRSDRLNSQTPKMLFMEQKSDGWRIVSEKVGG